MANKCKIGEKQNKFGSCIRSKNISLKGDLSEPEYFSTLKYSDKDFDIREAINGMTERQLLKFIVIANIKEDFEKYKHYIEIAKEDEE